MGSVRWTPEDVDSWLKRRHGLGVHHREAAQAPAVRGSGAPAQRLRAGKSKDRLEGMAELIWQVQAAGLAKPETEFRFHVKRRWRADLAWPVSRLLVEFEGGVWAKGPTGHNTGAGIVRDIEKYNDAVLAGWRVLRFTVDHVRKGQALAMIEAALKI